MARFRRRSFTRGVARTRSWARENQTFVGLTPGADGIQSLTETFRTGPMPGTIYNTTVMAIRWYFSAHFNGVVAPNVSELHVGIIAGDYSAPADVPRPFEAGVGPRHADWMWYEVIFPQGQSASSTITTGSGTDIPFRQTKARRRLDELNSDVYLVAQHISADPGADVTFQFTASTLLLQRS